MHPAQPVGSRVTKLAYDGLPVQHVQPFALAVNDHRRSGGGFPAVSTAPVIYSHSTDVRQQIIDWVSAHHTIDPHPVRLGGLAAGRERSADHRH